MDEVLEVHRQPDPSIVIAAGLSTEQSDILVRRLASVPLPPPLILMGAPVGARPEESLPYLESVAPEKPDRLVDAVTRAVRVRSLEWTLRREVHSVHTIAEAELRYREAFGAASDAIFMVEADGTILDANRSAARLTGRPVEELVGVDFGVLGAGSDGNAREFLERALASSTGLLEETTFVGAGDRKLRVSISATPIEFGGQPRLNLICRDVTEAHTRLVHAERLAILGSMLAGLAHEMKTPLAAISANIELFEIAVQRIREQCEPLVREDTQLRSEWEQTIDVLQDVLRTNQTASGRLSAIIRSAGSFTRSDCGEKEKADVHDGLDSSLILIAHEIRGRVEVTRDYGSFDRLLCYPGQINQVFVNLLVNSAHAIEGRGKIDIRTWEEGGTVRVAIADTGVGMSDEVLRRIFQAGFTTKGSERGSGLGLSISNSIVQNHGGTIDVKSRPGQGTTFTVILPRTPASD